MKKNCLISVGILLLLSACNVQDFSKQQKLNTENNAFVEKSNSSHENLKNISTSDNEKIKSNQDAPQIHPISNVLQTHPTILQSTEEKETETPSILQESSDPVDVEEVNSDSEQLDDTIIIGGSEYILIKEDKFKDWITVAEKYEAKLYAIPNSDVFAIVKNGEVLAGMSTGVANSQMNNIDILCDLMLDKGIMGADIIAGIKHVTQTGESVNLVGPQEFDDDFAIFKQDEWIVVLW